MALTSAVDGLVIDGVTYGRGDDVDASSLDDDRVEELIASGKLHGTSEAEYPRYKGGGVYELSDGSTVKGKDAAREAEADL